MVRGTSRSAGDGPEMEEDNNAGSWWGCQSDDGGGGSLRLRILPATSSEVRRCTPTSVCCFGSNPAISPTASDYPRVFLGKATADSKKHLQQLRLISLSTRIPET